jgi:C4-dicarboxylate-specific signal transduction histidine kinase
VGTLLDAHAVAVWQLQDPAGEVLELAWGVDDEQPMSPATLPAGDGESPPWQCLRAQRELQLDGPAPFLPDAAAAAPKAPAHGSALLLPLRAGGTALGVLVLQSRHAGVYGERERHVPRCLAAATAQALAGLAHREHLARADTDLDPQRLQGLFTHTGKLAAVARLATQVAREMEPPLAALADLADTLTTALEQRHLPGPAANARSMHREVEQLEQLARRLRHAADTGAPQLTQGNVRSVFDEARGLYGARLATEHIVCDEAIPPLTVQADTERLSLTIANLVFNAADAMEGRADKHLWLSAAQHDGEVTLSVRDNGPGLPGDVGDRLFEPFFTTKPEGQGVGLGLALAAQSVAAMKGRITAGNASEGGAVFTIVLPAA